MDSNDNLTSGTLSAAAERLSADIARTETHMAEEERKLALYREEYRLINRLLELRRGEGAREQQANQTGPQPVTDGITKQPALEEAVLELIAAGRPLHISEIMRALKERSVPVPGAGEQANLIALLTRDSRIVRPARGLYGLLEWGLEAPQPIAKTRKRRKHVRVHKS